jgi:hypothetical protein
MPVIQTKLRERIDNFILEISHVAFFSDDSSNNYDDITDKNELGRVVPTAIRPEGTDEILIQYVIPQGVTAECFETTTNGATANGSNFITLSSVVGILPGDILRILLDEPIERKVISIDGFDVYFEDVVPDIPGATIVRTLLQGVGVILNGDGFPGSGQLYYQANYGQFKDNTTPDLPGKIKGLRIAV